MATVEEKKRIVGTKVSAIANIFQSKPEAETCAQKQNGTFTDVFKDSMVLLKESSMQVTVVRTESHIARFNTARALFEKLGEENKSNHPIEQINKSGNVLGLRSRSSSVNSSSGCMLSAQSTHNQLPLESKDHCSNWSVSVPILNVEHHFENDHLQFTNRCNKFNHNVDFINYEKNYINENHLNNGFEKTEQLEKKLSSKELIEKQKNWTSHFSKTKANQYNSDTNKYLIQSSLNETIDKIGVKEDIPNTLEQSFALVNNIVLTSTLTDEISTSDTRSEMLCSVKPSRISSILPQIPFRNLPTNSDLINSRSLSIPYESSVNPNYVEYATVNKIDVSSNIIPVCTKVLKEHNLTNNKNTEIPEYATIQKKVVAKTKISVPNNFNTLSSRTHNVSEYDVFSENNSINNYKLFTQLPSQNFRVDNKESLLPDNSNCNINNITSLAKNSKCNESVSECEEIIKPVSKQESLSEITYNIDLNKKDNKESLFSDCKFRKLCGEDDNKLFNVNSSDPIFEDTKRKNDEKILEKFKSLEILDKNPIASFSTKRPKKLKKILLQVDIK